VMVPDAEGCPVGIFTERDVVRLYADGEREFETLALEARMTCSVKVGRLSMSVDEALGLMTERRFRHLPVVEDGKLLGLVSIGGTWSRSSSAKRPRKRRRCEPISLHNRVSSGVRLHAYVYLRDPA
jgi:signal-transduction protein with cAMP-binding, CBS, and nucleotidyltransferase domain